MAAGQGKAVGRIREAKDSIRRCIDYYKSARSRKVQPWVERRGKARVVNPLPLIEHLLVFITPSVRLRSEFSNPKLDEETFIEDIRDLLCAVEGGNYSANPYLLSSGDTQFVDVASKLVTLLSYIGSVQYLRDLIANAEKNEIDEAGILGQKGEGEIGEGASGKQSLLDRLKAAAGEAVNYIMDSAHSREDENDCFWAATSDFEFGDERSPVVFGHTLYSAAAINALNGYLKYFPEWGVDIAAATQRRIKDHVTRGVRGLISLRRPDGEFEFYQNVSENSSDLVSTIFALDGIISGRDSVDDKEHVDFIRKSLQSAQKRVGPDCSGLSEFDKEVMFIYIERSVGSDNGKPTVMNDRTTIGYLLKVLCSGAKMLAPADRSEGYVDTLDSLTDKLIDRQRRDSSWRDVWYSSGAVEALCAYVEARDETNVVMNVDNISTYLYDALQSESVKSAIYEVLSAKIKNDIMKKRLVEALEGK